MEKDKEFVSYDIALALKELGFDEPCMAYWVKSEFLGYPKPHLSLSNEFNQNNDTKDSFSGVKAFAPLYQRAFRWLFDELHKSYTEQDKVYSVKTFSFNGFTLYADNKSIETFENKDACLRKLIEIVKENL